MRKILTYFCVLATICTTRPGLSKARACAQCSIHPEDLANFSIPSVNPAPLVFAYRLLPAIARSLGRFLLSEVTLFPPLITLNLARLTVAGTSCSSR
jgi:hypothetical protein